jgi:hypothetical protein
MRATRGLRSPAPSPIEIAMEETERCPGCGSALAAVVIHANDREVMMRSCTRCDRRWWTADGEVADPTEVFAKRSA